MFSFLEYPLATAYQMTIILEKDEYAIIRIVSKTLFPVIVKTIVFQIMQEEIIYILFCWKFFFSHGEQAYGSNTHFWQFRDNDLGQKIFCIFGAKSKHRAFGSICSSLAMIHYMDFFLSFQGNFNLSFTCVRIMGVAEFISSPYQENIFNLKVFCKI